MIHCVFIRFEDLFKSPPKVVKGSSIFSINDFKAVAAEKATIRQGQKAASISQGQKEAKRPGEKDAVTERLFMEIPFLSDLMKGKKMKL